MLSCKGGWACDYLVEVVFASKQQVLVTSNMAFATLQFCYFATGTHSLFTPSDGHKSVNNMLGLDCERQLEFQLSQTDWE